MKAEDTTRPDGRFVIGISDIRGKVGAHRQIAEDIEMGEIVLQSASVRTAATITLDADLEVLADGLSFTGTIVTAWTGECRRCLEEVEGSIEVPLDEIFEVRPTEGETYKLGYDTVNIEPAVRDTLVLNLPMTPLCADDCVGPDPERFPTFSDDDDDEGGAEPVEPEKRIDPRWAALANVQFDTDPASESDSE